VLLILLCVAGFLATLSVLMLGPLLVPLAHEFQTSVALVGQLAAATAITWGMTAPLVGPVSDAYGRRRMPLIGLMLMALGILGSILAWHYSSLLAFRLLTGVGAAIVGPNNIAAIADVFPPTGRGKAIGWLVSATGVGAAVGVPLVAFLFGAVGWSPAFGCTKLHNSSSWHALTCTLRHKESMPVRQWRAPRSSQVQTVSLSTWTIRPVARSALPSANARPALSTVGRSAFHPSYAVP
jgi:predicted MFS family arabinose efflux permease